MKASGINRAALSLALAMGFASSVFGASVACPGSGTQNSPSANVNATSIGLTVPGGPNNNSLDNINNYTAANNFTTSGCVQLDQSFNNFRSGTGAGVGGSDTISSTGALGSDTGQPAIGTTYAFFTNTATASSLTLATVRTNTADSINNFFDQGGGGNSTATYDYLFTVDSTRLMYQVQFFLRYYNFTDDAANSVTLSVCSGYTATAAVTASFNSAANCGGGLATGTPGGTLTRQTFSLVNLLNNQDAAVNLFSMTTAAATRYYIDLHFTIDGSGNGVGTAQDNSYLWGIGLNFSEAPEPATYGMIGGALGIISLVRYRRRRKV
jgi:hypothetical protein